MASLNIVNLLIQGFEQRDLCIFNIGEGVDNAMVFICNLYGTFVKFPGLTKVIRNVMIPNH